MKRSNIKDETMFVYGYLTDNKVWDRVLDVIVSDSISGPRACVTLKNTSDLKELFSGRDCCVTSNEVRTTYSVECERISFTASDIHARCTMLPHSFVL